MALVAIALNLVISFGCTAEQSTISIFGSAYVHMVGDAPAGVGVVIAGVIVWLTGASIADPIVSLIVGGLILYSSRGI